MIQHISRTFLRPLSLQEVSGMREVFHGEKINSLCK